MKSKKKSWILRILVATGVLLLLLAGGFLIWALDYYQADETAKAILETDFTLKQEENDTILYPEEETNIGIIFYPGAKVEAIAYLPILEQLKEKGYLCVLVEMPLNMAIFDQNAADGVYDLCPEIDTWYMAGHSMGGAMAGAYAGSHQEEIEGLILMGAYLYGDFPAEKTLIVYGSYNSDLEKKFSGKEKIVEIEGGNHAMFGNYGKQKGDPDGTISAEEQQKRTVEEIELFIGVDFASAPIFVLSN